MYLIHCLVLSLALILFAAPAESRDYLIEDGDSQGLREAILLAADEPGPDRIFLPAGSSFLFFEPWRVGASTALPPIHGQLDLVGNGSVLRRYSDLPFAILAVAADGHLRLVDTTLTDGGDGALRNRGELFAWGVTIEDSSGHGEASALLNLGQARLLGCEIRFNSLAGSAGSGGAVVNRGWLEMTETRLYGNTAFGGGVHPEFGAALTNYGDATLTGTVVADNGTVPGAGGSGAIANFAPGRLLVRESVIEGNEPAALAIVRAAGQVEFSGTRVDR